MFKHGGQAAIDRMVQAYGFKTKVSLCEQLGISTSVLANRYSRDTFPADYVIQCALETGASLRWLSTGDGVMFEDGRRDVISLEKFTLLDGKLAASNFLMFDKSFLPDGLQKPQVIVDGETTYIVDRQFPEISDGRYLVDIEGKIGIHDIERIPVRKIRVSGGGLKLPFECSVDDISIQGKIKMKITRI
ncbi:phage repressor protein CI [Limnobaculum xujianqingii]|uniref:phage repressor protein CI n=1 Tax=Limnobaculum xujianqingii TaxID=2738837 RepID=UPI0015B95A17|nr:phage repressor protein CI [Limnobaculum xujianqingii]